MGRRLKVASSLPGCRCNDHQTAGTPASKSVQAIELPLLISSLGCPRRPVDGVLEPLGGQADESHIRPSGWTRSLQPDRVPTCTPVL